MIKLLLTLIVAINLYAGERVKISLTNANGVFYALLDDTKVAHSFASLLPLRLNLGDYAAAEKYAHLPKPLDTSSEPKGATGKKGELSYFAPWRNFVIYYADQPYYEGIVRLGEILELDKISKIAIDGEIVIKIEK